MYVWMYEYYYNKNIYVYGCGSWRCYTALTTFKKIPKSLLIVLLCVVVVLLVWSV